VLCALSDFFLDASVCSPKCFVLCAPTLALLPGAAAGPVRSCLSAAESREKKQRCSHKKDSTVHRTAWEPTALGRDSTVWSAKRSKVLRLQRVGEWVGRVGGPTSELTRSLSQFCESVLLKL